jgi:GntR family transcriptional repressor for pyruvate dehydrogenase complex
MSGAARSLLRQPDGQQYFEQARSFFEVGLVRYAAEKAGERDLERLRAALEANRASQDDVDQFKRSDIAFHYVLAEIPRNPIFPAIHNAIAEWLTEQRRATLRIPGQTEIAYKAHERIYRAIASRSADKAEKAMNAHLGQVFRIYRVVRDEAARRAPERRAAG